MLLIWRWQYEKFFPDMLERPENEPVVLGLVYWIGAFFLIPAIFTFFFLGGRIPEYEIWVVIVYHIINFVVALLAYRLHLVDAFINFQINTKEILTIATICALIIFGLRFAINEVLFLSGNEDLAHIAFNCMPITEADFLYLPAAVLEAQPLFGILILCFMTPLTVSCLLYGCVFAPICVKKPWLAYVVTIAASFVQRYMIFVCLHSYEEQMALFWLQVPAHLIACWSYQKTDTIWTPIAVHMIANIVCCLYYLTYFV
jgi:hypothetical protein